MLRLGALATLALLLAGCATAPPAPEEPPAAPAPSRAPLTVAALLGAAAAALEEHPSAGAFAKEVGPWSPWGLSSDPYPPRDETGEPLLDARPQAPSVDPRATVWTAEFAAPEGWFATVVLTAELEVLDVRIGGFGTDLGAMLPPPHEADLDALHAALLADPRTAPLLREPLRRAVWTVHDAGAALTLGTRAGDHDVLFGPSGLVDEVVSRPDDGPARVVSLEGLVARGGVVAVEVVVELREGEGRVPLDAYQPLVRHVFPSTQIDVPGPTGFDRAWLAGEEDASLDPGDRLRLRLDLPDAPYGPGQVAGITWTFRDERVTDGSFTVPEALPDEGGRVALR